MKIASWNINALKKHKDAFLKAIAELQPDIFCLQEIRSKAENCAFEVAGYDMVMNPATESRYYGTGVYYKKGMAPQISFDFPMPDGEHHGRIIKMEFPEFVLVNSYWPFSSTKEFLAYRLEWCSRLEAYIHAIQQEKPVVICGDMNTVQAPIDAFDGKIAKRAGCFYKEEQDAFRQLLANEHLVDAYRYLYPQRRQFSTWAYSKGNVYRLANQGFRIDFFLVAEKLMPRVVAADILTDVMGSDHCPIWLDINMVL